MVEVPVRVYIDYRSPATCSLQFYIKVNKKLCKTALKGPPKSKIANGNRRQKHKKLAP